MRGKGLNGKTCAETIREVIRPGEILTFSELFKRVKERGTWSDETIWQHLMACVVNLPPARRHWLWREPFLLLREDGRYELYNPQVHPQVQE